MLETDTSGASSKKKKKDSKTPISLIAVVIVLDPNYVIHAIQTSKFPDKSICEMTHWTPSKQI
ncbi:hypothetical protein [Peribacillus sp. NPDC060253]|uniref:hypothetical protein n=1 Tax=Peribacillus sp. NPDC060253 TaxID=3347084 RepID=UPI00364E466D